MCKLPSCNGNICNELCISIVEKVSKTEYLKVLIAIVYSGFNVSPLPFTDIFPKFFNNKIMWAVLALVIYFKTDSVFKLHLDQFF